MSTAATARWPRSLPWWWRLVLWSAMTAGTGLLGSAHWSFSTLNSGVVGAAAFAAGGIAVQFSHHHSRRVRQILVIVVTIAALASLLACPSGLGPVLLFLAGSRIPAAFDGSAQYRLVGVVTVVTGLAMGWAEHSWVALFAGAGIPLVAQRAAIQRELVAQRDRAQALLAEVRAGRAAETREAALRERGRIAGEMHDLLAHSLAGLSLHLQGARAVAAREHASGTLREALDKAAGLAQEGLAEARAAVSTLHDSGTLGLDALAALVNRHPGATRLQARGPAGELTPTAGHAVYRAVQEALTNAARYAPGSPVAVVLDWEPGRLAVTIDDDGPGPGHQAMPKQGTGLGLTGMSERIGDVSGTVSCGPRSGGGWRVRLELPSGAGER